MSPLFHFLFHFPFFDVLLWKHAYKIRIFCSIYSHTCHTQILADLLGTFFVSFVSYYWNREKFLNTFSRVLFFCKNIFSNNFEIIFSVFTPLCSHPVFRFQLFKKKVKSILGFQKWTKINVQKRGVQKSLEKGIFPSLSRKNNIYYCWLRPICGLRIMSRT